MIVNDNDMTKIMYVSLIALAVQSLYLMYVTPIKIFNDPKKLWGPFYLCRRDFWQHRTHNVEDEATHMELTETEKEMIEKGTYEQIETG